MPGVDLAGPLPPELQLMTRFAAGVCNGTPQADAARALIRFLATPDTARVMHANGLEPLACE